MNNVTRLIEIIDGAWFACSVCMVAMFARYVLLETRTGLMRVKAANAVLAYFIGSSGWHGLSWWLRAHPEINNELWVALGFILSGSIAGAGAIYCIKIFTPPACSRWSYLAAIVAALVLSVISIYIT